MTPFDQLLTQNSAVVLDGGMGTNLLAQGLPLSTPAETWLLSHPDRVQAIHEQFASAGAQILLTNSFGANRARLAATPLAERVAELNQRAVALAKVATSAETTPAFVAGSMGPTFLSAETPPAELHTIFSQQAAALAQAGADLIWLETMGNLTEAQAAVEAAHHATQLPICLTFSFHHDGRLADGTTPAEAVAQAAAWRVAAVGANCGTDLAEMREVVAGMVSAEIDLPLIAKPNAGVPQEIDGEWRYPVSAEQLAQFACEVHQAGIGLIGGCCGVDADMISAVAQALTP